jgi:hypothetical protein
VLLLFSFCLLQYLLGYSVLLTLRLCIQPPKDDCLVLYVVEFHLRVLYKKTIPFVTSISLSAQRPLLVILRRKILVDELLQLFSCFGCFDLLRCFQDLDTLREISCPEHGFFLLKRGKRFTFFSLIKIDPENVLHG